MSLRRTHALRRVLVPVAAATALVAASALPASAHVSVSSPDAAPGGFGKVVFRVPTESDDASTTALTVTLPTRTPFAFVSSKPLPGWSVSTTTRTLDKPIKAEGFTLSKAVSTVTWKAQKGNGIEPGEFDEFELSVGPFPKDVSSIAMPAKQTYSDGSVVRWDDPAAEGEAEPEHPAPTLELAAAGAAAETASHGHDSTEASTAPASSTTAASDTTGRWLGGAGLGVAVVALVVALTRGRRTRTSA